MIRARRMLPLAVAAALAAGALAGCGSDDGGDSGDAPAATTATAPTTAPEVTAPTTTAGTTDEPPAPEPEAATRPGEVATGAQVFVQSCEACHADGGRRAGYGPQLQGAGVSEEQIRTIVVNGRGVMPAGLVAGQELEDVVAYVASLQ